MPCLVTPSLLASLAIVAGDITHPERRHELRPVEECQPLLGPKDERLEAGFGEGLARRHDSAADLHLAPSDQREREMGKRREIARGTNRALRRYDGMDPQPEEVEQPIDDLGTGAGVAQRDGIGSEQEHRPNDIAGQRIADPCGVAHQEVLLESLDISRGDRSIGEGSETGRDAVHDGSLGDEAFDHIAGFLNPAPCVLIEDGMRPVTSNGFDIEDGEVRARQDDGAAARRTASGCVARRVAGIRR